MIHASPVQSLAKVRSARVVIQDFCPLADSIEWQLGQRYWRHRGSQAFIGDAVPVPYLINNDSNLSASSAEVLFSSLVAAEQGGTLEPDIFVLELGIGVGLFARFFLDRFRQICDERGKDYYDRIHYVAADYSEQMLRDAGRHGIFANHPGRYLFRAANALCPERTLVGDPIFGAMADRPFPAIFLNYLLDCLPATVLRLGGEEIQQLCVRTCLARGIQLNEYTDATVEDLARLARSDDPDQQREPLAVFGLLTLDYDYQPVSLAGIPHGEFAVQFARQKELRSVLHNFGAIQCLECSLGLLRDQGFILMNDYGNTQAVSADEFQHQRFSRATAVGINFPLLTAYFRNLEGPCWVEPPEPDTAIHARLLARQVAPETTERFQECFGKAARDWREEPFMRARECAKEGSLEAALAAYQQALERQPQNWALLAEVGQFLVSQLQDAGAGFEMAKAALACNPACSADLWNLLGDCLYFLGRIEESERAYLRALQVNPNDVRARYNLVVVYHQSRRYRLALQRIAEALELDGPGIYRDSLLQKQTEVLAQLSRRQQQEYRRLADLVNPRSGTSHLAKPLPDPDRKPTAPQKTGYLPSLMTRDQSDQPGPTPEE
jgi:tetratricopeptide (TPR) repeat protein